MKISFLNLTIIIFILPRFALAQEIELKKQDFKSDEDYQKAISNVKLGDQYYTQGKGFYEKAIEYYAIAHQLAPENTRLNYRIGSCIFYGTPNRGKADGYFTAAYNKDPLIADDIHYLLARTYQFNLKFDEAVKHFELFRLSVPIEEQANWDAKLKRWVEECQNGKELLKNPLNVEITNMGNTINTHWSDHSPLINADESMLIYTSQRDECIGGKQFAPNKYFEDVYVSYNEGGNWKAPENIGQPINTEDHDATVGISPDGRKLYLYRSNTNSGDIFESAKEGDTWTIPTPLKGNVNTQYQETSASFSPDGGVLYFVSNRLDDNKGGKDIYIAYKNDNNVWEKVENLGPVVNSPYDEEGVFMHPDGRTLYFSSKGHNTMGGFDIFKTVRDTNGIWSKPVNIGYPVNTPENDVFLVMSSSGDHGYFSSYKEGGLGEQDIYKVVFLKNEETNDTISTDTKVTIVSGQVTDPETDQPLEANIEVVDNDEGKVVSETKSDAKTGKYLVALPSGKDYGVTVESDGYLFQSENFNIPDSAAYSEVKKDIKVPKVQEGANIILKNIFFEYFSSRLSKKSTGELNRILKVLNRYPQMKIEISGHTDNIGPEDGNRRLSQARAKAVSDYLVSNGIDKDRLVTKGHGSTQPIADNSTPQGQSENRRVEFRILSK